MPTNVLYKRYVPMHANHSDLFGSSGFDGSTEPNLSLATNWLKEHNHLSHPIWIGRVAVGKAKVDWLQALSLSQNKVNGRSSLLDKWVGNVKLCRHHCAKQTMLCRRHCAMKITFWNQLNFQLPRKTRKPANCQIVWGQQTQHQQSPNSLSSAVQSILCLYTNALCM